MEDGEIVLTAKDGSEVTFFVLANEQIAGKEYLLVADHKLSATVQEEEDKETEVLILRKVDDGDFYTYEVVEDDKELKIISKYFEEVLEDYQIETE